METAEAKLNTKLTQLSLMVKRSKAILDAGKTEAMERHLAALKNVATELDQVRIEVEAQK